MNVMRRDVNYYDAKTQEETGKRIQEVRKAAGVNADVLSGFIGITDKHLSKIEHGKCICTTENLYVIAQYLDVSVDYLLFGKSSDGLSQEMREIQALCEGQPEYKMMKAVEILRVLFE